MFAHLKNNMESIKNFGKINECPKISVIIVAYNTKKELLDCLNSLNKQSVKNFEIIIVDNGNEDLDKLKKYSIRYIKLDKNYGPSYARNIGTKFARAKIVAFLDDDAIADKNWVKNIIEAFEKLDIIGLRGKVLPKNKNTQHKRWRTIC